MENKDQNNTSIMGSALDGADMGVGAVKEPPPDPDALSLDPSVEQPLISQEQQPRGQANVFLRFARRIDVMLAVLLLIAGAVVFFSVTRNKTEDNANTSSTTSNFGTVSIPLDDILSGKELSLAGTANVTINGPIQLNNGLYVAPTLQPTGARAGQIYYDESTNQLAYFNGEQFVFLTSAGESSGGLQSLGGATGAVTLGDGLSIASNQLGNTGVLSVQGQSGDVTLTAGPGIVINGTSFSNGGVISIAAGSPNVNVANDGNGNVTLTVSSGAGTITSSGGTTGRVPLFTASQNIEDSIITQSGLTVTISGDLSVVTGGLTLSNALTVSNGGTGTNSLANNGVLLGNGTAPVTAVASGGPGLCLISTAGAPSWAACPSGGGVTSLNSLTGALSIANASAAGSTITIDDASAVNKGIASFNATNFSVTGGAVNTAQNIDNTATPTFAGVNTNNITPSAALTVGISAQTALLQGSTTTITSNGAGNNIVLNSAATIELQDNTNVTGNVTASGDVAVNGGDLTSAGALNITPGGTLTVGVSSQTLTLQGGASTSFRATSGANTTVVAFSSPTANTTLNFPALAAGTYTVCTTSGNCSGAAATLQSTYDNSNTPEIVLDATRGALTIRDNATPLGANLLEVQNNAGSATYLAVTATGIAVTGTATVSSNINSSTGTLQTNGTNRIDNSGNAVNLGNITLSGAISGGTTITGSGNINSTGGAIQTNGTSRIDNGGNLINIAAVTASGSATFQGGAVTIGTSSQAGTVVLHDGSSNTGTLQVAALGQDTVYTLPDPGGASATICLTTGNCSGVGGGVTTSGGTTNRLAKFTGSQAIGDSSISDDNTNVTVSVDVIIQGGDLTVGTTSQAASVVMHDGSGQTTTLQAGNSAGNMTFILPTNTGSANQCLKQSGAGNQLVWQDCDGGAGGSSSTLQTAYNNSVNPEITLNSSVGGLTIRDNSTPLGANLFEIQNNAGSTTYLAVTVTGVSVTGLATATGNVNTSGGTLQTNGTNRIDNSGNAVNIGNITGSGAITIASIGAGSDITIDGTDQFIVQDSAVFNALTTFNANIDLGANDIVGTTGDINLTNFDVDGTTGNITAGTYNGQTISSSANFTGTVAVAGNTTLTGDVAVNGGDLTSTGALNITPAGTLTAGVTGQQLILQGNASTRLTATGGGFTTTLGFNGSPVGAVTYNFDRAAAAGTYTICTTVGNCSGVGGGVTTLGGTTGALAKFTGAQTLGDSLLSESGSTVTVNGNLNLITGNQFQVNGTQISSAVLSNDANLAKLSASQTFTGNTVAFQNAANSTNAFNIQNQTGGRILTVNTTAAQVVLGTGSALDGSLVFNNMSNNNTVTILPGIPTGNRTLTLPDASGILCTDSGNCAGAGATLQTSYNFSVGGTTPKIKVNGTLLGVDIQDADTTIAANLFNIRASNGGGLGSVMFGVGNTGVVTLQNSSNSTSAFRLLTQGGTSVLTGDTQNGSIILGQSGTLSGSLIFNNATNSNTTTIALTTPTSNHTITLPNATGTVCLSSGNCSGSGSSNTLQAAYDAGNTIATSNARDVSFALADTASDANFLVDLQCDTSCGSNGRFAIQDDGADVFTVSPAGGAVHLKSSVDNTTAFNVKTTLNNNLFTIDTLNSQIGINLGGNNLPSIAGGNPGLQLQGALRISGTTGLDSFTTPVGASVAAKINVEIQSLPNFGQVMAMGVNSASDVSSRVLSLFDARTTRHQPTLAVFNPDENASVGFSWNGSSATASIQTSDSDNSNTKTVILQSGNVTAGNNNSGDVQVNTGTVAGTGSQTGAIYLVSGDGVGTNTSSGNVYVDVGVNTGAGTRGTLNVGVTNANTVLIGRAAGTTTLQGGTTNVSGTLNANGDIALGNANTDLITVNGVLQGTNALVFEGSGADANETTLAVTNPTADRTITIPDATGTICLQGSVSCGFLTGTSADYIQNQNAGAQTTSNFWISGTGRADGAGGFQAPSFDTATAAALSIGASNANAINIGKTASNIATTINGTALIKPTSGNDSTTAFQVQNAAGTQQLVNVNTTGAIVSLLGSNQAAIPSWTTNANNFASGRFEHASASNDGFMYVVAGYDNSAVAQTSVYYAKVNAGGSVDTWGSTTTLPLARAELSSVVANGYIYAIGGRASTGGNAVSTVYYAKLNTDGTAGSWNQTTALPDGRTRHTSVVANGYVYVMGGADPSGVDQTVVYYARLNPDGTVGAWNTTSAFSNSVSSSTAVVANGYVYMVGGAVNGTASTQVAYAKLNTNGTLSAWNTTTVLPNVRHNGAAVVLNGYLYHLGGEGADYADVYYAPLNANGTVGSWTQTLDMNVTRRSPTALTINGYIYALGGENGSAINTLEYASPSRVSVGGSLDLVGNNGENLAEGGSGGHLTAGNTRIVGSLNVSGSSYLKDGATISNSLSVDGLASFKANSDSTGAFRVLNASAGELVNVDSLNSIISLLGNNTGHLKDFTVETDTLIARESGTGVTVNGYLYNLAGCDINGANSNTTQYAKINADGSTGAWATTTVIPYSSCNGAATSYNGYIYVTGGGGTSDDEVYYAKPNRDGTITSWASTTVLPASQSHHAMATYNGYIYVLTGRNLPGASFTRDLYYARLAADGTIGAWTTVSNYLPVSPRLDSGFVVGNGNLYVVGGRTNTSNSAQTSVYYSKVNLVTGAPGTATATTQSLPLAVYSGRSFILNGHLYSVGGQNSSGTNVDDIYYAPLDGDGNITTTWATDTTPLPGPISGPGVAVNNGYAYVFTGWDGSNEQVTSWYTTGPRVKIGGALDLISYNGENNTEGSTGGQLTAGDTKVIGDLGVTGSTNLQDLNVSSFQGAGLTDCDSYNSKLLYDASTKQFSCGSDKPTVIASKAADQTATSAFVTDDTYTFAMGANETWVYTINAAYAITGNTQDVTFRVNAPASATCRLDITNVYNVWNGTTSVCGDTLDMRHWAGSANTDDQQYLIWGTITTGATPGNMTLQWMRQDGTGSAISRAKGFLMAYKLTGADLAEAYYTKDSSVTPGTVVSLDGSAAASVKKTSGAYDSHALGVVSTAPGQILGDPHRTIAPDERPVLLALSGRIPVRVSLENGPIQPGDYLTTSSTPGVAMKATKPGQMIGKALEGFNSNNPDAQGSVMTFANLTYADPNTGVTANGTLQNGSFGDLNVAGAITTKALKVTGKADINELVVGTMSTQNLTVKGTLAVAGDINLQGVGKSRNAITKKFVASKHIPIGSVVIVDPINDGQVTTTTVMADTRVLGVALTEAEAGEEVTVAIGGTVQVMSASASMIQGGDLMVSSGQEGLAEKSIAPVPGSMVGKALGRSDDGQLVWILISLH